MSIPDWQAPFIGKIPSAGIYFQQTNWLDFKTQSGLQLATYRTLHKSAIANLVILHGMFRTGSLYSSMAAHFHQHGFSVFTYDIQDHGRSQGLRGHIKTLDELTQDAKIFVQAVKDFSPTLPLYVIGQSAGGATAIMLGAADQTISGLVLLNPAINFNTFNQLIARNIVRVLTWMNPTKNIRAIGKNANSNSEHFLEWKEKNPYIYSGPTRFRVRQNMVQAMAQVKTVFPYLKTPFLVISGLKDVQSPHSGSLDLIRDSPSVDKTLWIRQHLKHTVVDEPDIE